MVVPQLHRIFTVINTVRTAWRTLPPWFQCRQAHKRKKAAWKRALHLLFIEWSTLFATQGKQISSYIQKDTLNEYFHCKAKHSKAKKTIRNVFCASDRKCKQVVRDVLWTSKNASHNNIKGQIHTLQHILQPDYWACPNAWV